MAIRKGGAAGQLKQILKRCSSLGRRQQREEEEGGGRWEEVEAPSGVPRGHFAVYVGERRRRFVVPIAVLDRPEFRSLLRRAEEEFGFAGAGALLVLPCEEVAFRSLTSSLPCTAARPPELLLGATNYAEAVDIWSVGCIFAEFLLRKPLFPGRTEQEQLSKIFELCGYPNEENWPGASKLPLYKTIHSATPTRRCLRDMFKNFDFHAVELIDRMLILNPSQRISAQDALSATYFIQHEEEA